MDIDLTYCVVNNDGRDYLLDCLAAIERNHPAKLNCEVLVLDNFSSDGSVEAVQENFPGAEVIALGQKTGKADNDTALLKRARGRYCLLLNEDSEVRPGAVEALVEALESDPEAGAAGAQLFDGEGNPYACAWKFPGVKTAAVGAAFLHSRLTVQSGGERDRRGGLGPVERDDGPPRGRRSRSAGSTRTSSSTTTNATSAGGWPTPAGTRCTYLRPKPSTTTSLPPTYRPGCRASSSSTATATST